MRYARASTRGQSLERTGHNYVRAWKELETSWGRHGQELGKSWKRAGKELGKIWEIDGKHTHLIFCLCLEHVKTVWDQLWTNWENN